MKTARIGAGTIAGALTLLALAGCGSADSSAGSPAPARSTQATALVVIDPWVKAAETGMTGAFGTFVNNGGDPLTVRSASSSVATAAELHETVRNDDGSTVMQPKKGGFTVAGSAEHVLAPGGDHLMLMDLTRPLRPGERVAVTLVMADGSSKRVTFTVKNFTGADEKYRNGGGMQGGMG